MWILTAESRNPTRKKKLHVARVSRFELRLCKVSKLFERFRYYCSFRRLSTALGHADLTTFSNKTNYVLLFNKRVRYIVCFYSNYYNRSIIIFLKVCSYFDQKDSVLNTRVERTVEHFELTGYFWHNIFKVWISWIWCKNSEFCWIVR